MISNAKVLELSKKYGLVENLDERESNPEGVGLDIRAGEAYRIISEGYLGISDRKSSDVEKIADIKNGDREIIMEPGDFVLVKTMEIVNVPGEKVSLGDGSEPKYLAINVYPRSTLQRCGIYFMGTKTDPGYHGELTFALANMGKKQFRLALGARIANIVFVQVTGEIYRAYGGQWKGGRVSTGGLENQV